MMRTNSKKIYLYKVQGKDEAVKTESVKYETFCEEVMTLKALTKYGAMNNKSRDIPNFTDVREKVNLCSIGI